MRLPAIVAAIALTASSALAADDTSLASGNVSPLAPGKPAGMQQAQLAGNALWFILGGAIIIAGVVILATNNNSNNNNSASSTH